MQLLRTIRSCIWDPAFYADLRHRNSQDGIKLYAVLVLLVFGAGLLVVYFQMLNEVTPKLLDKVEAAYPDELVVTVGNGAVSINQPEPYFVQNNLTSGGPKNLVIFDTGDALEGDADANSTLFLVKKNYVVAGNDIRQQGNLISAVKTTTTIEKADLLGITQNIRPYLTPVVVIGGAIVFLCVLIVGAFFMTLFHLVYLVFPALGVYLFVGLRKQMGWRESYLAALYASVPVAIISYLMVSVGIGRPAYAYTLLVLLIAILNLSKTPSSVLPVK